VAGFTVLHSISTTESIDASFNRIHVTFPDSILLACPSMILSLLSKQNKTTNDGRKSI
jgi:hypothetical protein